MTEFFDTMFLVQVGKIMWIDILLSGDNALVIALACRELPPRQRMWGMILGALGAVLLRVFFTGIITYLLTIPYLKMAGGIALVIIAAKLLIPEEPDEDEKPAATMLIGAIVTIVIADISMSIDNVIAVAAAADGHFGLMVFGLALSIPLIVAGANLISGILNKFPVLVWAGAGLLGWIAGEVIATDPLIQPYGADYPLFVWGICGIATVLGAGGIIRLLTKEPAHELRS